MTNLDTHAETLQQLKGAREWLRALVDQLDLDPDETALAVAVVSPTGAREVAKITLATSLMHIDACLAAHAARPVPPSGDAEDGP